PLEMMAALNPFLSAHSASMATKGVLPVPPDVIFPMLTT
ncbi:unnamed protein product, partial [marine sediment metagenome]